MLNTFGELFKKYRLRSGFATIGEFADALAEKGFIFEESLFSHWQKNTRIPKDRRLILAIIKIFLERKGINSTGEVNKLLESMGRGYLTFEEEEELLRTRRTFKKTISPQKILKFLLFTLQSKKITRTGWTMLKVKDPESAAEHSFQLSAMVISLADQYGLDKEKLFKMSILHDLGEVATGDIVYMRAGKFLDLEKQKRKEKTEITGIKKIFQIIGENEEFENIFNEMLERKTEEAKIFWQLDKLEMAIQALQYEKDQKINLEEFFLTADLHVQDPYLRKILRQVIKSRRP